MRYSSPPVSVRSLEQRLRNLENDDVLAQRRRITMALVVIGQMLPEGAVKGGSALALRCGSNTRFTRDFDVARRQPLEQFRADFEASLAQGWSGVTGRLIARSAPRPPAVPPPYVMQPFDVKLDYRGRPWCTVTFELGHNEIGDADTPEFHLADDLRELFLQVGLPEPDPIPVMGLDHQVAQKLHALTSSGSERARDLVDLQLMARDRGLDLARTKATCERLFTYRRRHAWPPVIIGGEEWESLYRAAAEGLDVLADATSAIAWGNEFVQLIANS